MEAPPVPDNDPIRPPDSAVPFTREAPAVPRERIEVIDLLRGVAILGILALNIFAYAMPAEAYNTTEFWGASGPVDRAALAFITTFATMKFLSMLAILFGVGMCMQTDRIEERAGSAAGIYVRRTFLLMGIGFLHVLLFWWGDILIIYSLAALVVFAFHKVRDGVLRSLAVVLFMVPVCCCIGPSALVLTFMEDLGKAYSGASQLIPMQDRPSVFEDAIPHISGNVIEDIMKLQGLSGDPAALAIKAHYMANGSWTDVFVIRMTDWAMIFCSTMLTFSFCVMGLMTIGLLLGRHRVLAAPEENRDLLRMMIRVGLLVGLPFCMLAAWVGNERSVTTQVYWMLCLIIGAPLLGMAYLGLLTFWFGRPGMSGLKRALTACGRMAMTNYLMHTVVFTTIFHSWGFGLFGRFSHAELLLFAVPMWAFQLWFSPWWLARYEFGPIEWVWRWGTYGKKPPFQKGAVRT